LKRAASAYGRRRLTGEKVEKGFGILTEIDVEATMKRKVYRTHAINKMECVRTITRRTHIGWPQL
jgi:hypothetical protein